MPERARRRARPRRHAARGAARCRATGAPPASAPAPSSRSCAPTRSATTSATSTRGDRPHRRAARPPARARARADDVDRARRLAVDGVRHRQAAEGRRRRGRRAGVRRAWACAAPAASAWSRFGAGEPRAAARRAAPSPGSSRCAARWPRASRPTARTTRGSRRRARAAWRALARQPGLVVVISRLPRPARAGSARSARCASRHSVLAVEIVDPREAELPAVGHLALVDPETGARVEVDTSRRRVRERFAAARARAPRARRARAAPPARRPRHAVAPTSDWLRRRWGGACDELRRARLAARRCCAGPAGDRWRWWPRAGARAATRCASRRSHARSSPRPAPCRSGAGTCRRRWRSPRSPRSRSRWPSRSAPYARARRRGVDHAGHRPLAARWRRPTCSPTGCAPRGAPRTPSSISCRAACSVGVVAFSTRPTPCRRRRPTTTPHATIDRQPGRRRRDRRRATRSSVALAAPAPAASRPSASRRRSCCCPTARATAAATRRRSRARPRACKIPIYTVALGTQDAVVPNPDPFGAAAARVPPDPETLRPDRAGLAARRLHRPDAGPAGLDLQEPRLAARHQDRAARGDRRVRGRPAWCCCSARPGPHCASAGASRSASHSLACSTDRKTVQRSTLPSGPTA